MSDENALVPAVPTSSSVDVELAEISELRRRAPAQYHKNSEMRARERELLSRKFGVPRGDGSDETAVSDDTGDFAPHDNARKWLTSFPEGEAIVDDWAASGGFDVRFQQADDTAERFLQKIDPESVEPLLSSFGTLDDSVVAAVMGELSAPASTTFPPLSDAQLERFSSCEVFAPLFREFGPAAPAKLGLAVGRVARMLKGLPVEHADDFLDWFNRQPAEEQRAIVRGLVR